MKKIVALLLCIFMIGCTAPSQLKPEPLEVPYGYTEFMADLAQHSITPTLKEKIAQPSFSPKGQVMELPKGKLQVFEYSSNDQARLEATYISPDGYIVNNPRTGRTENNWFAEPHFYRKGRLLILYIGTDSSTISTLEEILGKEVAGAKTAQPTLKPQPEKNFVV